MQYGGPEHPAFKVKCLRGRISQGDYIKDVRELFRMVVSDLGTQTGRLDIQKQVMTRTSWIVRRLTPSTWGLDGRVQSADPDRRGSTPAPATEAADVF